MRDTDHSLKAGPRGPVLLQDHHLREKIMHFDHERIPERVVHARGAAAHGVFKSNGAAASLTCASFLAKNLDGRSWRSRSLKSCRATARFKQRRMSMGPRHTTPPARSSNRLILRCSRCASPLEVIARLQSVRTAP